jgi:hypothetical protein
MRQIMAWRKLAHDQGGTSTVEFTIIAPLFLAIFFAIIGFDLAVYWWKSAEKATQAGARMAVVSDAAVTGLPAINVKTSDGVFGQPCNASPSPCQGFGTLECTGTACTGSGFATIQARMQGIFPLIQPDNIRIRYDYISLGFAGGPVVPAVTVTLTGIQIPLIGGLVDGVFRLLGDDGTTIGGVMPDIRATLTGEDLTTGGTG